MANPSEEAFEPHRYKSMNRNMTSVVIIYKRSYFQMNFVLKGCFSEGGGKSDEVRPSPFRSYPVAGS
jgi:hypothetical protein